MNRKITIITDEQRIRPEKSEVNRLWACNKKASDLLSWSSNYGSKEGFKKGLTETIEWFTQKSNLEKYKANIYNV